MVLNKGKFDESGFTLIEMVLVITILGLLAGSCPFHWSYAYQECKR